MKKLFAVLFSITVFVALNITLSAQDRQIARKYLPNNSVESIKFVQSDELKGILTSAVNDTLKDFADKGLKSNEIAATLIDMRLPDKLARADYRGNEQIYPASVVKMFYMATLFRQIEDGKVKMTPELDRGLKNMIIESGNESTGYILDVLTDTSSGAELPPKEFEKWKFKRNAVNRYFQSIGYSNINVNQKTHCEDAWGVEQQFRNYKGENRNMLTTNATAQLLAEIASGKSVNPARSKQMMDLMKREWEKPAEDAFHIEFISHALKPGTKIWSKEGWTSSTRHDAAYIETPEGLKFVLVVFTENHAKEQEIIPSIARKVIDGLGDMKL
jgi:beta-lactamase class A